MTKAASSVHNSNNYTGVFLEITIMFLSIQMKCFMHTFNFITQTIKKRVYSTIEI